MEQSNQNAQQFASLKVSETGANTNSEEQSQQQEVEVSKRDANQSRISAELRSKAIASETEATLKSDTIMGEASSLKRPSVCLSGGDTTTSSSTNKSKPTKQPQLKAAPAPPAAAAAAAVDAKQPAKKKKRGGSVMKKEGATAGRWTPPEHAAFLQGLALYGREWKRVSADIPTRSASQVRSHAQKYFAKLQKEQEEDGIHNNTNSDSNHVAGIPADPEDASSSLQQQQPPLSDSVRREAARILAHPETVEAEVQSTLQQLRERYVQLQQRLEERSVGSRNSHSAVSAEDEMIALHVLQGGLKHDPAEHDGSVHSNTTM